MAATGEGRCLVRPVEHGSVCGAVGCPRKPEYQVTHPAYGLRVLCSECTQKLLRRSVSVTGSDRSGKVSDKMTGKRGPAGNKPPAKARERSEQERGGGPGGAERRREWRAGSQRAGSAATEQGGVWRDKRSDVAIRLRSRSRSDHSTPERSEGGSDGGWGGAYRTLHYASAMSSGQDHGRFKPSTVNIGGSP